MKAPEVGLSRPECDTGCSVDECVDLYGRNLCKDENGTEVSASNCTSSVMEAGVATSCSKKPSGFGQCCLGTARPLDERVFNGSSERPDNKWLQVVSDEDRIARACQAFNTSGCPAKGTILKASFLLQGEANCVF